MSMAYSQGKEKWTKTSSKEQLITISSGDEDRLESASAILTERDLAH